MMLQLNPPIPLQTPKGSAWATAMIDYGPQWDLMWVTFVEATGECWTFRNPEIRQGKNYTFNHPEPTPIRPRSEAPQTLVIDEPKKDAPLPIDLDFTSFPSPVNDRQNGKANGHHKGSILPNGSHS